MQEVLHLQEIPTQQQSLVMLRNVLRTAFSAICYNRRVFPEEAFGDKALLGMTLKSLRGECGMVEVEKMCRWLEEGVFEALQLQYLRTIVFGFYVDAAKPFELIESYKFDISYPDLSPVVDLVEPARHRVFAAQPVNSKVVPTRDEIKNSTITMLRTLVSLVRTLSPLPSTRFLTLKLLYYEDRTPSDWEPAFFRPVDPGTPNIYLRANGEGDILRIPVGEIQSEFHKMGVTVSATETSRLSSQTQGSIAEESSQSMNFPEDDEYTGFKNELVQKLELNPCDYLSRSFLMKEMGLSFNQAQVFLGRLVDDKFLSNKVVPGRGRKVLVDFGGSPEDEAEFRSDELVERFTLYVRDHRSTKSVSPTTIQAQLGLATRSEAIAALKVLAKRGFISARSIAGRGHTIDLRAMNIPEIDDDDDIASQSHTSDPETTDETTDDGSTRRGRIAAPKRRHVDQVFQSLPVSQRRALSSFQAAQGTSEILSQLDESQEDGTSQQGRTWSRKRRMSEVLDPIEQTNFATGRASRYQKVHRTDDTSSLSYSQ